MFRSAKFSTVLGVAFLLGHASLATGDAGSDRKVAAQLHRSLPDLVVSEDYRGLSQATILNSPRDLASWPATATVR